MPKTKGKPLVPCAFTFLKTREDEQSCGAQAIFSAKYVFSNGDTVVLELCSKHLQRAAYAAEIYSARKQGKRVKVRSVQFNKITATYRPRSEAAIKRLPAAHDPFKTQRT